MLCRYHIAAAAFATLIMFAEKAAASGPLTAGLATGPGKDWALSADNGRTTAGAHIAAANDLSAPLAPGLFAHTHLAFEPAHDPARDQGPSLKEVYLQYVADGIAVRGGKLGRKLGISWSAAPGPWRPGFTENYESSEQIGVAADIPFDAGSAGKHVLTTGTFFAGTAVLSRSAFTDDMQATESDFSSYALALGGGGIAALPGFAYHLAYLSRDAAPRGRLRETGIAAAFTYMFQPIGVQVAPIVEWVSRDDHNAETDTACLTTGIGFIREGWTLTFSRTTRKTRAADDPEVRDSLSRVGLSYALESGIGINAGYSDREESGLETETYGFLVDYAFAF